MGIAIFLKFFNSNSHSHSNNFFFGIAIPIPILILELGFYESTTELGRLLISEISNQNISAKLDKGFRLVYKCINK
jgi:hypothetical protein